MGKSGKQIIFETERLFVRLYSMDDFDNFFRLNSDEEVMRYIRAVQTREQSKGFLKKIIAAYKQRPGTGRWGIFLRENKEFVGSFAVIPVEQSDKLQLGYALLKENWGKGYASESVKAGIQYAFDKLRLTEIAAITFPENISSQKVLLKNGFAFDKTFTEGDKLLNLYMLYRTDMNR
jgi:[ribosomal protein S5]-alanine N-acetyltransferase